MLEKLKNRVIELVINKMIEMKELPEKLKYQKWIHLFVCPLPVMYREAMIYVYKNFKLLEDSLVSFGVRRVDLILNTEILGNFLKVPVNDFDTYVRREWPSLGEKEDDMYLNSKYTQ